MTEIVNIFDAEKRRVTFLGVIPVRSILEKAIVHLLNGNQEEAETLFHKFMVEKARQIHETLREGDGEGDVELDDNWSGEIKEEEYFDDTDLGDEEADAGLGGDVGAVGDEAMPAPVGDEDALPPGDEEMGGDEDLDLGGDDEFAGEEGGEGLEDKIDNLDSKIDELTAEFDRLMAKIEDTEGDEGLGDEFGDEATDLDAEAEDEFGDEEGLGDEGDLGAEMGGEDTEDIADRMEDDLGDQTQPEHEMAEDTEMLEDITESVLAELDRISPPANTGGKEIGSGGKTVSGNEGSMLPNHDVNSRWQQAKPVLVKAEGDAHNDSFERETPPSSKKIEARRNNDAGVKKLKTVPKGGDSAALINKDFAGGHPDTKPIIDGGKKVK